MAEKTEKQPKKISIMNTLLLIALVPTLLTAIVSTVLGAYDMSASLEGYVYNELLVAAQSLKEYYETDMQNTPDHQPTYGHDYVDTFKEHHLELTLFLGDTRYITSIEDEANPTGRNEGTAASAEIWEKVSAGEAYTAHKVPINDGLYYVAYVPVEGVDGNVVGMAFAGKNEALVKEEIQGAIKVLIIGAFVVVLFCVAVVVFVARRIKVPMEIISSNLEALAEGNLGKRPLAHSSVAEIHRIIVARVKLTNALKDIVAKVQSASDELLVNGNELESAAQTTSTSADGISAAVEDISKGSISMAEDIEDANQKISDMGQKIEDIVSGMVDLNSVAGNMGVAGDNALAIIKALDASNAKTVEAIRVVAENVEATDRSVSDISAAVDLITAIASQTNLLSLNASIEAARAGDAGKGFAVVANEISKLADQSNESGQKIEEVLTVLIADSRRSMEKMTEVQALLQEQQENLRNTEKEFMNVRTGIQNTKQHSGSVDGQAKDCDASRSRVIDIISGLSAISEENAASTQETTASMQELNATINLVSQQAEEVREKAQALEEAMQFFKL